MPLAAQPLFQCHCHSILTLFPSRHHQADVFCLGIMPLRHWGYRLLLLLLLSVMLLGDALAFLVSVTNSVPCCWHHHHCHPLPSPSIAVAVDHCRHHCRRPLSSPSPSTVIITVPDDRRPSQHPSPTVDCHIIVFICCSLLSHLFLPLLSLTVDHALLSSLSSMTVAASLTVVLAKLVFFLFQKCSPMNTRFPL